jgi:SAM-dependent methyltransferase
MLSALPMSESNRDQAEYWSTTAGQKWVNLQQQIDALLAPAATVVLNRAAPRPGERVLDIGCGAGTTTLSVAEAVGPEGHVTGADISPPLLAHARRRVPEHLATRVSFIEADAQVYPFEPEAVDLVLSRFGVMFFADPVEAFGNLRRALKPGGRLCVLAWAAGDRNPWFSVPRRAAVAVLGEPRPTAPDAPGPLAFANGEAVVGKLRRAGFTDAAVDEIATQLTPPGDLAEVAALAAQIGPVARITAEFEAGPDAIDRITALVREEVAPYKTGNGFRVPAVLNLFTARA